MASVVFAASTGMPCYLVVVPVTAQIGKPNKAMGLAIHVRPASGPDPQKAYLSPRHAPFY
jgi:hypothetical protein